MVLDFLPEVRKCCCIKSLRAACMFIAIWGMFTASHSFIMLIAPINNELNSSKMYGILVFFKWSLVLCDVVVMIYSFALLLSVGLRLYEEPIVEYYVWLILVYIMLILLHVIFATLDLLIKSKSIFNCRNSCYLLAHLVYLGVWCYFLIVVNSYSIDLEGESDTEYEEEA